MTTISASLPAKAPSRAVLWRRIQTLFGLHFALVVAAWWLIPASASSGRWKVDTGILASCILGWMFNRVIEAVQILLDRYVPCDPLDAKRLNEQIKSLSTAINGAAGAGVSIFVLGQIAKDPQHPQWGLTLFALFLAAYVHCAARGLLGYLKAESESAYSIDAQPAPATA